MESYTREFGTECVLVASSRRWGHIFRIRIDLEDQGWQMEILNKVCAFDVTPNSKWFDNFIEYFLINFPKRFLKK